MIQKKLVTKDKVRAYLKKEILSVVVFQFMMILISETYSLKQDKKHPFNKKSGKIII